jgi:hypothetical protein
MSVVITFTTMFAAGILLDVKAVDLVYIVLAGVVIALTFFAYEGGLLSIFNSYSKFEIALRVKVDSENKEYLMKIQREEMRHMIGKRGGR